MGGLPKFIAELSALPLAGLLAAALLARLALRGRRIDDHPLCRACGYDLFGIPPDTRHRCPECGHDVRPRSAIVIGHRARRRGVLRLALALALLSGLGLAIVGRTVARGLGDYAARPTWWLIHELDARPGGDQHAAFAELNLRYARGDLSPSQVRGVTDAILAWQADTLASWNVAWGDFVEIARANRQVTDDQWARYLRQGVVLWLTTRPIVRQGDDPQFAMPLGPNRFGSRPPLTLRFDVSFQIDGLPATVFHSKPHRLDWGTRSRFGGPLRLPAAATTTPATQPVRHTVQADIDFEITEGVAPQPSPANPTHRWRQTLRSRFELVPADRQTVELVRDPAVLARLAQSLKLRELVFSPDTRRLDVGINVVQLLPVDFAADVIIRAGDHEWITRGVVMNASSAGQTSATADNVDAFDATHADVIIRGSAAAASRTTDMTRVWGGELIFENVPVTPSDQRGVPKPLISPTTQAQPPSNEDRPRSVIQSVDQTGTRAR